MFKKRYLLLLVVLLSIVVTIVSSEIERHRIIAVCRDALVFGSIVPEDLKYEGMKFYTLYSFVTSRPSATFSYRDDQAVCGVHRNGLDWEVESAWYLMLSSTP